MKHVLSVEGVPEYCDGVVAYHQYKQYLGLTIGEAKEHPDTQEAFLDTAEVVAASPELVLAYTGALKERRSNARDEARQVVRGIEREVIEGLYLTKVITNAKYGEALEGLETDEAVVQAAQTFVKLFKGLIPKEQLPRRKRRQKAKHKPEIKLAPIEQDSEFHLVIDEDDTVVINGKKPLLTGAQDAILRILLGEARTTNDPIAPSYFKYTTTWKQYMAGDEASSHRLFTEGMRGLRQTFENNGLGQMIMADGTGRGRTYQLRLDSFGREGQVPEPTPKQPVVRVLEPVATDTETPVIAPKRPERLPFYEAEARRAQEATARSAERSVTAANPETSGQQWLKGAYFAQSIVDGVARLEDTVGTSQGVAQRQVIDMVAEATGMEPEAAVHTLRSLRDTANLFIVKHKGTRFISTRQPAEQKSDSRLGGGAEKPEWERIQQLREQYGAEILRFLSGLSHRQQTEFKTAIAAAVAGLPVDDVNAVCNLLKREGLVYSKEKQGRGTGRSLKGKTWAITGRGRSSINQHNEGVSLSNAQKRSLGAGFRSGRQVGPRR